MYQKDTSLQVKEFYGGYNSAWARQCGGHGEMSSARVYARVCVYMCVR